MDFICLDSTSACTRLLAEAYRDSQEWQPDARLIENYRDQVEHYFTKIPVRVRWLSDEACAQPFDTHHGMISWLKERGELLMLSEHSDVLGRDLYSKHRAVHDWYGHIVPDIGFGGPDEARSFIVHLTQFSRDVLPIVLNDVVLTNNYWEYFGEPWKGERWVYRPDLIGAVESVFGS